MVAFGDVMIDRLGPIRSSPSVSGVSGLLANALGIRREEFARLARLQERLIMACRMDRPGTRFTDFQTAQLGGDDRWWTTSGRIQERAGGADTFNSPHIRERDYDSDVRIVVALRLRDAAESPTIDDLARALQWPARPLFLGRKCCLPSAPFFDQITEAESSFHLFQRLGTPAFRRLPFRASATSTARVAMTLPPDEPCPDGFETVRSTEWRDWPAGVHAGEQRRYHGTVPLDWFAPAEET